MSRRAPRARVQPSVPPDRIPSAQASFTTYTVKSFQLHSHNEYR